MRATYDSYNRSVRRSRAKDRVFELFISHLAILPYLAGFVVFSFCIIMFFTTLADVASEPVVHSSALTSEQAPYPSFSPIPQGHAPSAQANRPGRDLFARVEQ